MKQGRDSESQTNRSLISSSGSSDKENILYTGRSIHDDNGNAAGPPPPPPTTTTTTNTRSYTTTHATTYYHFDLPPTTYYALLCYLLRTACYSLLYGLLTTIEAVYVLAN